MVYNTFETFKLKTYPQIEKLTMTLGNLIKTSTMGGLMLIGLNLLSQPAQAISVGFSFANLRGNAPRGANQLVTGTIDGLVEGNNPGAGVTATVLSTPTGAYVGRSYSFSSNVISESNTDAFIVTNGNITFVNALFLEVTNPNLFLSLTSTSESGASALAGGVNDIAFINNTQPATFTATAVPWETDAIPVIGSTVLFGLGLWAKNKFAKPLLK